MIIYLIKSSACLLLLLVVYRIFFEKEKMHCFNRFYLIISMGFSLIIPVISIHMPQTDLPITYITPIKHLIPLRDASVTRYTLPDIKAETKITENALKVDYFKIAYGCIAGCLFICFLKNLFSIYSSIRRNKSIDIVNATLVLVDDFVIPYSFFKYIFVNKAEYEKGLLKNELLLHELTHVNQKHSFDIVLIELLKIIFWFNPVFGLYKKAIQLNHEFLADERVLKSNVSLKNYQYLLLSKAGYSPRLHLTSNFNYSITKKRLLMMNQTTSKLRAVFKVIALFPLMFIMAFFICIKVSGQVKLPIQTRKTNQVKLLEKQVKFVVFPDQYARDSVLIHYTKNDGTKYTKRLSELSAIDQKRFKAFLRKYPIQLKRTPTDKQFNDWKNALIYGVWLDGKHVKNEVLNNYKSNDFAFYYSSKLYGRAKKGRIYSYQVNLCTLAYYEKEKAEIDAVNSLKTTIDIQSLAR